MTNQTMTDILAGHNRIALDSTIFIYHFENAKYQPLTSVIFEHIQQGLVSAVASTVVLTEILRKAYQLQRLEDAAVYELILTTFPNLELIDVSRPIGILAAEIGGTKNIKTPDALHIATAFEANATLWVTNDKKLRRVESEIAVLILDDWL